MLGSETIYAWSNVKSVDELDDRTEIWLVFDNLITVRDRAFATLEEKQKFVTLLHRFSQMSSHKKVQAVTLDS